ncbi:unnamed protein product [Ectocarpus sp. 4 AP-2014]
MHTRPALAGTLNEQPSYASLQDLQGDIRQWLRRRPRVRRWLRWWHTFKRYIVGGRRKTWRTNGSSLLFKNLCGVKERIKQNGPRGGDAVWGPTAAPANQPVLW